MKKNLLVSTLSFCLAAPALADDIVVSLKPLHSLVQAVLGDSQRAVVLIDDAQSPHDLALRPSQARLLHNAKLVFFVREDFETVLPHSITDGAAAQPMAEYPRVMLLPARDSRLVGGQDDDHKGHDDHDEHGHAHSDEDLHIWLDIDNAKAIARHLPSVLAQAAPQHRAAYQRNADALIARLDNLDAELKRSLAPVTERHFVVQHDAYQYFDARYGLQEPLALLQGHLPPSAGRLRDIRRIVQERDIRCFFTEPQFSDGHMRSIVSSLGYDDVTIGVLDPLGSDIAAGEDMYFSLMATLAENMRECLDG